MLFLTGVTGRSGRWFLNKLAAERYPGKIRCLIRRNHVPEFIDVTALDIEYVHGKLDDLDFVTEALRGVRTVVHFASIACSRNLILACQKNAVEWAVLVHTTGRFSKYKSASEFYIETENWVLQSGVNCTILRPTMIYGSHDDQNIWKLINFISRHKFFPVFGNGKNLLQPIYSKDLGEAVYGAFANRQTTFKKNYNIAGKDPITYNHLLNVVSQTLGKQTIFVHIPYFLCYIAAFVYEKFTKTPVVSVEQIMRMNEDKAFDYSDAQRDFGFNPISFEEGVAREVQEFRKMQLTVG